MTVSPWLTFEKLKELQEQIDNAPAGGEDYFEVNSSGTLPLAIGTDAIAIGEGSSASGAKAISLGFGAIVQSGNPGAICIGENTNSDSANSISIGTGANVGTGNPNAVCIGNGAGGGSDNGVAVGNGTSLAGDSAIAIGNGATINAAGPTSNNIAIGNGATVTNFGTDDAIQLGAGSNSTSNTIQYLNVPIANSTGLIIPGPFADDTAAAGGGVGVGNPYYTAAGDMKVRLT